LRQIKIGRRNEAIEWTKADEIGALIVEYNRIIEELDENARILAATERETAWREMAKQIAHEVKNPLTPMRLSIQYLQMQLDNEEILDKEMVEKVSHTLIEQIDNVNHIVSEFSNFAKMPEPENEKVVLNDVVSSVHDLFRKRDDMDINLYIPIDEIQVFADKNHLMRVMTNLLKNAIQAIPKDRRGRIDIHLFTQDKNAIIKVIDNGEGIPDDMKEKVFKPNFTSKSSGTGLGLAICANIVEGFNGEIYFESSPYEGTTFFVEIPLMHTEDNFLETERVVL
jgi:nitrogen fixation/metabolism regulation signal transduction histidine kinase